GYGGSSGRPTETGLMADAAAAYVFAIARYPAERIVLWGESLGSALAIALAAEKPVGKVVLEAPFTSAVPAVFFATCARLISPEVKLTIEQSLPGNLSPADWHLMMEVVDAVRMRPIGRPVKCSNLCLGSLRATR